MWIGSRDGWGGGSRGRVLPGEVVPARSVLAWKWRVRVAHRGCAPHRGREDGLMGLFRKTPRPAQANRKPTLRERRAAQRTADAEARLLKTEQQIHDIADEVRSDLK